MAAPLDYRLWFVEGVLPHITRADRARWEAALADRTPVQVQVAFKSVDGRVLDFEMRSSASAAKRSLANPFFVFSFRIRIRFSSVSMPHTFRRGEN